MKRLTWVLGALALLTLIAVPIAGAYGSGAQHETWQVGLSINCNNPTVCGTDLGGFWGWAEFDRSSDGTTTWGDAEFAGCGHVVGGGGPGTAGAGHVSIEIDSWTIEPGSAGPSTFFANGTETDFSRGTKTSFPFVHVDTGIPSIPGHYSTESIFGFKAPGVAGQIQVAYRPAR